MAHEAAATTIINAIPVGLRWKSEIGHVLFKDTESGNRFTVEGMTIEGGKGPWACYNRIFKNRNFRVSLNWGGKGVHYAEGIRWDDSIRKWVDVPKPKSYLWVKQVSRWTYKTECLVEHVWDPSSFVWEENSIDLLKPLYQSILMDSPLKCWDCYSGKMECECPSVLEIRQIVENISSRIEANICGRCFRWHTTPDCLVCSGDYITVSLVGIEPDCPVCHQNHDLDECVSVKGGCDHSFHEDCIEKWRRCNNSCPICRGQYPSLMDDGDAESDSSDEQRQWHSDSDSDSYDGEYHDPMDDYSDCGNPICHCQYNHRHM
jgi:hypothetical protein